MSNTISAFESIIIRGSNLRQSRCYALSVARFAGLVYYYKFPVDKSMTYSRSSLPLCSVPRLYLDIAYVKAV